MTTTHANPSKRPSFWKAVALAALVALTGAAVVTAVNLAPPRRPVLDPSDPIVVPADAGLFVPPFELVDANGSPIDESILEGRFTVMDFFFTSCPFACPGMVRVMARVQEQTSGTDVRLLSVSVDGFRDTPEVIRDYASRHGAKPQRWTFATGEPESVARMIREGLKMPLIVDDAVRIPVGEGETMANIEHPVRLLLVGPDRRVLAMALFTADEEVDRLIEIARRLASGGD